jgi:hypothetical protein
VYLQYAERLINITSEALWSFAVLGRLNADVFLHSVKPVAACLLSVAAAKQLSSAQSNQLEDSHRWPTFSNEAKDKIAAACMTLEVAGESDKVVRCRLHAALPRHPVPPPAQAYTCLPQPIWSAPRHRLLRKIHKRTLA